MTEYRFETLSDRHRRAEFSCGIVALDRYLQKQARQDVSKRVAANFVVTPDGAIVAGFYTLSATLLNLRALPDDFARTLPRYPSVPATLLGRLAVSTEFRGQGLGEALLINALKRVLSTARDVASAAVVVDAKDESVRTFYMLYDFIPLPFEQNRLYFPVRKIATQFGPPEA